LVNRVETDEQRKYRESLESANRSKPNLKLVGNNQEFLNKEEIMIRIVREMGIYCKAYSLPPLIISDNDLNSFFDILYRTFTQKGKEDNFYDSISGIVRLTFAKALINKTRSIKINDFIANLHCLQAPSCGMDEKEILNLQKEIVSELQAQKVVKIENYIDKKR
jgi:hypothetical protein